MNARSTAHPRLHVPCGACGLLVPAATGCAHWRPARTATAARSAEYREREKARKAADRQAWNSVIAARKRAAQSLIG